MKYMIVSFLSAIVLVPSFMSLCDLQAYDNFVRQPKKTKLQGSSSFYTKPEVLTLLDKAIKEAKEGNVESAIVSVEEALKIHPKYIKTLALLAYLHYSQEAYESAFQRASEVVELDPFSKMGNLVLGLVKVKQNDLEQAQKIFEFLLEKYPGEWKVSYQMGSIMRTKGNIPKAIEFYRECMDFKPDAYICHNELAVTYLDSGDDEKAYKLLILVIDKDPYNLSAYINLVEVVRQTNRYFLRTIDVLKQGAVFLSDSQEIYALLINLLQQSGREAEAVHYRQMANKAKKQIREDNIEAKAYNLKQMGRLDEAAQLYRSILEEHPDDIYSNYHLAGIYRRNGNIPECIRYYNKIISIQPQHHNAISGLALCHLKNRDYSEAAKYLQQALSINKKDIAPCINLGLVYELSGDIQKAIDQLLTCRQYRMTSQRKKSVKRKLRELSRKLVKK